MIGSEQKIAAGGCFITVGLCLQNSPEAAKTEHRLVEYGQMNSQQRPVRDEINEYKP
jgi:hypothetical protein